MVRDAAWIALAVPANGGPSDFRQTGAANVSAHGGTLTTTFHHPFYDLTDAGRIRRGAAPPARRHPANPHRHRRSQRGPPLPRQHHHPRPDHRRPTHLLRCRRRHSRPRSQLRRRRCCIGSGECGRRPNHPQNFVARESSPVFRADARAPDEIVASRGFQTWEPNGNGSLVDHLTNTHDVFVSTASDEESAYPREDIDAIASGSTRSTRPLATASIWSGPGSRERASRPRSRSREVSICGGSRPPYNTETMVRRTRAHDGRTPILTSAISLDNECSAT